jgi:hypothetical protein
MSNPHFVDLSPDDVPGTIPRTARLKDGFPATLTGAWSYPPAGDVPHLLKVRYDGAAADGSAKPEKTMTWWRLCADDLWEPGQAGHHAPLYGLASIQPGKPVLIVEGEKAAAALHSLGIAAVSFDGTGAATSVDLSPLDGRDVVLWPDFDKPGADAMDTIAGRLTRAHRRIDPAVLDLPTKGDAADMVGDGMDMVTLRERLNDALVDVAGPVPPAPMGQHMPDGWLTEAIPEREFVFRGALPLDAVSLLVATGGTGKSMLALELAASAATARVLLAGFEPTAGPHRVALLALEDDQQEVKRRMQRIARAFGLGYDAADPLAVARNVRLFCLPTFTVCSQDKGTGMLAVSDDLQRLTAELAEFKPRLVIADPLAGLLGGVVEEGSNEAAQAIIGLLRNALPPGAALLVCAHTSKAERLISTTARGASAWMDAARQVLALRPPTTEEARPLGDDALRTVVLQMTKSNYSALAAPMYLQRCTLPDFAGVLKPFDFAECKRQATKARTAGIADAVLLVLPDFPVSLQDARGEGTADAKERGRAFREALDTRFDAPVKKGDLLACLRDMLKDGQITQHTNGKRKVLVPVVSSETDEESPL